MQTKKLYWISGIIASIFIIILIILRISNKIKLGGLIIFVILVIILVIGVDLFFTFKKTVKADDSNNIKRKIITKEEAIEIHNNNLMSPEYAEYEDKVYWQDVLEMGRSNTPIYFRMVRGLYDKQIYGTVINMLDINLGGTKEYDDTKTTLQAIANDMLMRGNKASFLPSEDIPFETFESFDPITGRMIVQTKPQQKIKEEEKKEEKGVSLQ